MGPKRRTILGMFGVVLRCCMSPTSQRSWLLLQLGATTSATRCHDFYCFCFCVLNPLKSLTVSRPCSDLRHGATFGISAATWSAWCVKHERRAQSLRRRVGRMFGDDARSPLGCKVEWTTENYESSCCNSCGAYVEARHQRSYAGTSLEQRSSRAFWQTLFAPRVGRKNTGSAEAVKQFWLILLWPQRLLRRKWHKRGDDAQANGNCARSRMEPGQHDFLFAVRTFGKLVWRWLTTTLVELISCKLRGPWMQCRNDLVANNAARNQVVPLRGSSLSNSNSFGILWALLTQDLCQALAMNVSGPKTIINDARGCHQRTRWELGYE